MDLQVLALGFRFLGLRHSRVSLQANLTKIVGHIQATRGHCHPFKNRGTFVGAPTMSFGIYLEVPYLWKLSNDISVHPRSFGGLFINYKLEVRLRLLLSFLLLVPSLHIANSGLQTGRSTEVCAPTTFVT